MMIFFPDILVANGNSNEYEVREEVPRQQQREVSLRYTGYTSNQGKPCLVTSMASVGLALELGDGVFDDNGAERGNGQAGDDHHLI